MAQQIPLADAPRQTLDVILAGQRIQLSVHWSPRNQGWFLDARLPGAETNIVTGRRMAALSPLLQSPDFSGDLFVLPVGSRTDEPSAVDSWGRTHHLTYRP